MIKTDLTGRKVGRLTVLGEGERRIIGAAKTPYITWLCLCECGQQVSIVSASLISGKTQSCGCLYKESIGNVKRTHGESGKTKEHLAWVAMRGRCNNPNSRKYAEWGGRGIRICQGWDSYEQFLADMGRAPSPQHSLDRIDVNGNYEPGNCRWATIAEQANNKRPYKTTRSHCPHGHEYTPENTIKYPGKGRQCRECKSQQSKSLNKTPALHD